MQQLERGKRTTELLKQPQYQPLIESLEALSIWAVTNGYFDDVPVDDVQKFEKQLHEHFKTHEKKVVDELADGKKINEDMLYI
jgi:F-type H+-transporting ATPase subunit alpha